MVFDTEHLKNSGGCLNSAKEASDRKTRKIANKNLKVCPKECQWRMSKKIGERKIHKMSEVSIRRSQKSQQNLFYLANKNSDFDETKKPRS